MDKIPGLTGLFIAGILSGSLSTVSSAINSLAAVSWEDYVHPIIQKLGRGKTKNGVSINPAMISFYNKLLALLYGCVCIGVAFLAEM